MTEVTIRRPTLVDGGDAWRVARDSGTLDLNSSYAYLLFFRDFAPTCRVAVVDGGVAGFVLAHRPPQRPANLFVWQVAVDEGFRGAGIAMRMLDDLAADTTLSPTVSLVETTITDDNLASQRLFRAFADRWAHGRLSLTPLFEASHFPDHHDAEPLYEIGPLEPKPRTRPTRAADQKRTQP